MVSASTTASRTPPLTAILWVLHSRIADSTEKSMDSSAQEVHHQGWTWPITFRSAGKGLGTLKHQGTSLSMGGLSGWLKLSGSLDHFGDKRVLSSPPTFTVIPFHHRSALHTVSPASFSPWGFPSGSLVDQRGMVEPIFIEIPVHNFGRGTSHFRTNPPLFRTVSMCGTYSRPDRGRT